MSDASRFVRRFVVSAGVIAALFTMLPARAAESGDDPSPPAVAAPAPSGLLVAPTRVTFDDRHRSAAITVINTGTVAATYRISFIQMKMDENGAIREIPADETAPNPSDALVRYSPRQVYLEPKVAQTIRLQLRKPEDLPEGEYRSHLSFRVLPTQDPRLPGPPQESGGLAVSLNVVYGVSIPVIVRHGQLSANVGLTPLGLVPPKDGDGAAVMLRLDRTGNQSAYGDLTATFVGRNGVEVPVGRMNGLAVYVPNPSRTVRMPLYPPPGIALKNGSIRVTYAKQENKADVYAAGALALP